MAYDGRASHLLGVRAYTREALIITFTLPAFLSPRRLPLSCLPARRRTITILSFDNGDSTHIA